MEEEKEKEKEKEEEGISERIREEVIKTISSHSKQLFGCEECSVLNIYLFGKNPNIPLLSPRSSSYSFLFLKLR